MSNRKKMISLTYWPRADRAAWERAIASGDIFDGQGPAAHWAEGTKRTRILGYGRWIGFFLETDPGALSLPPVERVTPTRVRDYIQHLDAQVSHSGVFNYVAPLLAVIRVMAPGDWDWLKSVVRRLSRDARPRPKHHRMVNPVLLHDLGIHLMDDAARQPPTHDAAIQYRDGLIVLLLIARPKLRRRNLTQMTIGEHLLRSGDHYWLVFAPEETKTRQPIEERLPAELTPYIDAYLEVFRSMFPRAELHDGVWASCKGRRMCGEALYDRICKRTAAEFGASVNPHLFRDCAATAIVDENPDNAWAAGELLGHRDPRTTERHYIRANSLKASRALQRVILTMREEPPPDAHTSPRLNRST